MVSVQWTIVTYFLYIEMVIVFLLCLPISAHGLKAVMESFVIIELRKVGKLVFYSFIAVLIILFGDAVRVTFLSNESAAGTLDNELSTSKDLYKAERNCFISGFSLFLMLVINRLVELMCRKATLEDQMENFLREGIKKKE